MSKESEVAPEQTESQSTVTFQIDDKHAVDSYANFCRVTSTSEEVVLDLGLNLNQMLADKQSNQVSIKQRVVLSPFTAKRLAHLLMATIQRQEKTFGPIEIDIRKRAIRS